MRIKAASTVSKTTLSRSAQPSDDGDISLTRPIALPPFQLSHITGPPANLYVARLNCELRESSPSIITSGNHYFTLNADTFVSSGLIAASGLDRVSGRFHLTCELLNGFFCRTQQCRAVMNITKSLRDGGCGGSQEAIHRSTCLKGGHHPPVCGVMLWCTNQPLPPLPPSFAIYSRQR